MRLEPKLIALDLDGTLIDSAPDLTHCLGAALTAVGLPAPSERETRGWIGDGIETLLKRALAAASGQPPGAPTLTLALQAFDACYDANLFVLSRVYADVPATLDALRARGIVLGCVTNKRHRYATRLLELAGLRDRLAFVLGGDSCAAKKPHPAQLIEAGKRTGVPAAQAALVGDSPHDAEAAAAARFAFVWAAYGYGALDREPSTRIETFSDLLAIVQD